MVISILRPAQLDYFYVMKSSVIFILFIVSVLSFSGSRKTEIIGYWEVYKTENKENDYTETERRVFIEFKDTGVFMAGKIGQKNKVERAGKWRYKNRKNVICLKVPKYKKDNGDYKILQLTKDRLILRRFSITIYMEKGEK